MVIYLPHKREALVLRLGKRFAFPQNTRLWLCGDRLLIKRHQLCFAFMLFQELWFSVSSKALFEESFSTKQYMTKNWIKGYPRFLPTLNFNSCLFFLHVIVTFCFYFHCTTCHGWLGLKPDGGVFLTLLQYLDLSYLLRSRLCLLPDSWMWLSDLGLHGCSVSFDQWPLNQPQSQ